MCAATRSSGLQLLGHRAHTTTNCCNYLCQWPRTIFIPIWWTGQTQLAETCSEFTSEIYTRISKLQSTNILLHRMYTDVPMWIIITWWISILWWFSSAWDVAVMWLHRKLFWIIVYCDHIGTFSDSALISFHIGMSISSWVHGPSPVHSFIATSYLIFHPACLLHLPIYTFSSYRFPVRSPLLDLYK